METMETQFGHTSTRDSRGIRLDAQSWSHIKADVEVCQRRSIDFNFFVVLFNSISVLFIYLFIYCCATRPHV